jgi:hypothetical protein
LKAITLIQPWATLIETRSWSTKYRGELAIHAGKEVDLEACELPLIKEALKKHGYTSPDQLPTSAILTICNLFDCVQMKERPGYTYPVILPGYKLSSKEIQFGYYAPGRYAWVLANNRPMKVPVPAKGKQRLWEWKEGDSIG